MTFFGETSRTAHYAYRIVLQENLYICRHPPQGALNVSDTDGISYSMRLYLSTAMILEKQISEGEDDPFRKDDNSTRCSNILYDHATIKPTATQPKYQRCLKHETGVSWNVYLYYALSGVQEHSTW